MFTKSKWGGEYLSNYNTLYHKRKSFMKDKAFYSGFTLIELLAVIVILAVISLIAVPIIFNIIESSRKGAYTESLRNLIKATEYYEAREEMIGNEVDFGNGIDVKSPNIEMKNKDFTSGNIIKDEEDNIYLDLVSNGEYCGNGTIDQLTVIKGSCDQLDEVVPNNIIVILNQSTSNSLTVAVSVETGHSGVKYYEYSIDGGITYTKVEENSYTFRGLTNNTEYSIKVKVTSGNNLTGESDIKTVKTLDIEVPSYEVRPITNEWVQKKTVTITYPTTQEDYSYDYSIDKGVTWIEVKDVNKVNVDFISNGTIIARVKDGTNIMVGETFVVSNVDSEVPVINSVTGNSEVWVQSVTLNVSASDSISGLHDMAYSFDDGKSWQKENTKVFTTNQTVKIKVRDKALNEVSTTVNITKVDSGVPTAPVLTGGSTAWINGTRTISVSTDSTSTSGIAKYQYYISTANNSQTGGTWTDIASAGKSVVINTNGTRYIYFRAVNNAGKAGTVSAGQTTKIDTGTPTAPTITGGSTAWSSAAKNISVSKDSTSTSGIKNYQYYISTSNTGQAGGSWTNLAAGTKNISISTNGTRYIYFRAVNNAGKAGTVSAAQTTKIDTGTPTAPTITGGSTAWIKGTRTISVSKASTSTSGIKNYQYYISTSATGQAGGSWTNLAAGTTSIKITTNGTRYIYFRAVNNAGKAGTVSAAQTTKIDTTAPTVPTAGAIGTTSGTGTTGTIQTAASGSTDTGGSGGIVYKYLVTTSSTAPANTNTGFTTSRNYTRKCGTKYYGWAIAEDAVGNRSTVKSLGNTTSFSCAKPAQDVIKADTAGGVAEIGGAYRYRGANPNNYIKFNNETWRIILVGTDNRVKIMRTTSIGKRVWNNTAVLWNNSSLYSYLNGTYYNGLSAAAKGQMASATWNIGKVSTAPATTVAAYVSAEKETTTTGNVGLINTTDYFYASLDTNCGKANYFGDGSMERGYIYQNYSCNSQNWINYNVYQWTVNQAKLSNATNVAAIRPGDTTFAGIRSSGPNSTTHESYPVVFLKAGVKLAGKGTSADPYTIES